MTVASETHDRPLEDAHARAKGAGHEYRPADVIAQKYQLTRLLGQGGMGAVWLARNQKLDVDVAIKLIRAEHVAADTANRLLQEARAAARIGHRSIVRVFDFGETELDDPFIVMEMLTGESLRALLERKGRLPATQAVRTLLPIASALVEAHASGIVHRDLKPENVMLVPDTAGAIVPKLLDFGIAQMQRNEEDADGHAFRTIAGTPAYMSPEQMGGRDAVDEGADVWALGVMLYEAVTGHVPFRAPNQAALMFAVMTEEPTPTTSELAGDAELWALLHKALAKQSSARPRMADFGKSLAEWATRLGIESDIAGASIAAAWIDDARHPFSAMPPPVIHDGLLPGEASGKFVVPKAARLPSGLALTEAPPHMEALPQTPPVEVGLAPPPSRGPTRFLAAAIAGALVVGLGAVGAIEAGVLAPRGSQSSPQTSAKPPPPQAAVPASAPSTTAAPTASASSEAPGGNTASTPSDAASASSSATAGSATPPTTAEPGVPMGTSPPGPSTLQGRGAVRRPPPRKSTLPIAKQPNF